MPGGPSVIQQMVETCAAFVVVMTPEAERSEWVQNEISEARRTSRPILPVLLRGDRFFTLATIHYQDVRGGGLPGPTFIATLRALVPTSATTGDDLDELRRRHRQAIDLGNSGEHAEAVGVLREAVAARARVLGAKHVDSLNRRHGLAAHLGNGGERAEAVRIVREVVAARTRVLGADHADTKASRDRLRQFGGS